MQNRRTFLTTVAGAAASVAASAIAAEPSKVEGDLTTLNVDAELDRLLDAPVLKLDFVKEPVKIASIELLRNGNSHLLRTRSTAGVEVITVPHQEKIKVLYPILLKNVAPVFVGQDARDVERLMWDMYRH